MAPILRLLLVLPLAVSAGCLAPPALVERRFERSFKVADGSTVRVDLAGGSVTVITGPDGLVNVALVEEIRTRASEREMDDLLAGVEVSATQQGDDVRFVQTRKSTPWRRWWGEVRLRAVVTAPSNVRLALETRGGRIAVQGDRAADIRANTGGGSISADGGTGALLLSTSGGRISVRRALGPIQADTRGGRIDIDYVGPASREIALGTSGGGIRVGIDPSAALTVSVDSSGGRVSVDGLAFDGVAERSHASGTLNGGGAGRLRVSTGGGRVTVTGSTDPGGRIASLEKRSGGPASRRT